MNKKHNYIIPILLIILQTVTAQDKSNIYDLETYFNNALKDWNVPGMAIAIIKDDEILMA